MFLLFFFDFSQNLNLFSRQFYAMCRCRNRFWFCSFSGLSNCWRPFNDITGFLVHLKLNNTYIHTYLYVIKIYRKILYINWLTHLCIKKTPIYLKIILNLCLNSSCTSKSKNKQFELSLKIAGYEVIYKMD